MRVMICALVLAFSPSVPALAACIATSDLDRFVSDWRARTPTPAFSVRNLEEASCVREKLVQELAKTEGRVIGYKAALTGRAAQERFNSDGPISGVLFESMIVPSGEVLPATIGGNPVFEADMLLVVKDEGINAAKTPQQLLTHISGMRPFIEIPDLMLKKGEKLNAVQLIAMNAGGRIGVAGKETALIPTDETVKALADVKIVMTNGADEVTAEGVGAANLGNPLNVILWLVKDLEKSGRKLKAGDLVSIGSFSPLFPVNPDQSVVVRYHGLPGTPEVSVSFK